jgi:excisionase family DNA binding protein
MKDDILMTRAELMQYLKIKRSTLQKLMNRKEFPWFKLDRRVLFKKSDIDNWLESKRIS